MLKITRTSRLGFPYKPTCVAYDTVQHLVAVGTRYGYVKLYGAESIEYTLYHTPTSQTLSGSGGGKSSILSSQAGTPPNASGTASPVSNSMGGASSSGGTLLSPAAVLFMSFVVNEGALITYCDDGTLSFWNLRQKQPGILFTKRLINERYFANEIFEEYLFD